MSTYLTVRSFGQVAPEHRATLASLPATLRFTTDGTPDVALTAPDETSIVEALSLSPKAVVIADPATVDAGGSKHLEGISALIIPALTLTPCLRQIGAESLPSKIGFIHSRLGWQGDMRSAVLEHLVGLATVVGTLTDVKPLSRMAGGYVGSARTKEGMDVVWSGLARATSPHYELDVVGLTERLEIRAELDGSARPFLVRRGNAGGLNEPIASYETGLRGFWRNVADALGSGEPTMEWKDIGAFHALADVMASPATAPGEEAA